MSGMLRITSRLAAASVPGVCVAARGRHPWSKKRRRCVGGRTGGGSVRESAADLYASGTAAMIWVSFGRPLMPAALAQSCRIFCKFGASPLLVIDGLGISVGCVLEPLPDLTARRQFPSFIPKPVFRLPISTGVLAAQSSACLAQMWLHSSRLPRRVP